MLSLTGTDGKVRHLIHESRRSPSPDVADRGLCAVSGKFTAAKVALLDFSEYTREGNSDVATAGGEIPAASGGALWKERRWRISFKGDNPLIKKGEAEEKNTSKPISG
jgi:hypothetical protein